MVSSSAETVQEYLAELPEERRRVIAQVRETILRNLPQGYRESMNWGMISYEIPLEQYPDTYNKKPLSYLGLAAQKNHYALYMSAVYQDPELETEMRDGFQKASKKLDMGKSCIRFRKLEDIPLDVIGQSVGRVPPEGLIEMYEASRKT